MGAASIALRRSAHIPFLLLNVALLLLVLASWWHFLTAIFWPAATEAQWGRPAAYIAARLASEGHGDLLYERPAEFSAAARRYGSIPDIFDANLPTTLLLFLPLVHMQVSDALASWQALSLVCFLAAWGLLLWTLRLPTWLSLALSALVPYYQPLVWNTICGEVYTCGLLASLGGALLASREYRAPGNTRSTLSSLLAGAFYAICAIIRAFYGGIGLLVPVIRRQWKVAGAGIAIFLGASLSTLIWVPLSGWQTSISESMTWRQRPETAVTAYQTLNGFFMHLFNYNAAVNPEPVANLPWLVSPIWLVMAGLVLLCSGVAIARYARPDSNAAFRLMPYALAVPVALLLSPVAEDYHYSLALFPMVVAFAALWSRARQRLWKTALAAEWAILAAAVILLGYPFGFINVPGTGGWYALGYYPRLYGIALLWGLIVFLLWEDRMRKETLPPDQVPQRETR